MTERQKSELDNMVSYMNTSLNNILEDEFYLIYNGKGYSETDIESMSIPDRVWHVNRLQYQINKENEEIKKQEQEAANNS